MINFIVADLEETLIPRGEKEIPESTLELIDRIQKDGKHFAVVTGKNYDAIEHLFGKLKDIIFICNDGGSIIFQEQIISKNPVDRIVCIDVEKEMENSSKYQLLFQGERQARVITRNYDFLNRLKELGIEPEIVEESREIHGDITKIAIFSKSGWDEDSFVEVYKKWAGKARVSISDEEQVFITAPYVSKGAALEMVQKAFGISPEDTVVFGGGYTDIEMFDYSYFSYAMQHSDNQVRRAAKHIAENVDTILEDILRMR